MNKKQMPEVFTTKNRKKEFDKVFSEKIVPFFLSEGFERHTKTSKRLFKILGNGLSVFIFFEYKTFGYGYYDMTITYFDDEIGDVYNDQYLVIAKTKIQPIEGNNAEELNSSVNLWLKHVKSEIIPFIENHTTHKSILESDEFYISKARENEIIQVLKKKSIKAH
ncbi:hypothetical protein [Maribacter sp.]|uniref:hypothetical protein n=1 Tax=Maribacter sp. TaxID=1897614 RepID=UPI0025BD064B|nr:hypothetical protein [Maribacter sp.]